MDNMHNAELFGRVLTVNYAQPMKIKGGTLGWASQPGVFYFLLKSHLISAILYHFFEFLVVETVWADADSWFERQEQEEQAKKEKEEQEKAEEEAKKEEEAKEKVEEGEAAKNDPMAQAEAEVEALNKLES